MTEEASKVDLQRLYDSGYVVLNTRQLMQVLNEFKRANRAVDVVRLSQDVDPRGLHLMYQMLLHNDREWRCRLLVKIKDRDEPAELVQDVSMIMWSRLRANFRYAMGLREEATQP